MITKSVFRGIQDTCKSEISRSGFVNTYFEEILSVNTILAIHKKITCTTSQKANRIP